MGTYQGPNVSVTQQFVTNPPSVAIESLPSVIIATAYDVFNKQKLATIDGTTAIKNDPASGGTGLAWGVDSVVYNTAAAGRRAYDFFPVNVYVRDQYGSATQVTLDSTQDSYAVSNSYGVTIAPNSAASDFTGTYVVPNTAVTTGCQAFLPYYAFTAGSLLTGSGSTITVPGGAMATAKIKAGQSVFTGSSNSFTYRGVVALGGVSETSILLASPIAGTALATDNQILIGAAPNAGLTSDLNTVPNTFFDPSVNFIQLGVQPGDIIKMVSASFATSSALYASVISVDVNTLVFNTLSTPVHFAYDNLLTYKAPAIPNTYTTPIDTYSIERLMAFSKRLINITLATSAMTSVNTNTFTIATSLLVNGAPVAGDILIVADEHATACPTTYIRKYTIQSVTVSGANYSIVTTQPILKSGLSSSVAYATGDFAYIFHPVITSDITADFRAVRVEENKVLKRISGPSDILNAWTADGQNIYVENELAFLANEMQVMAGGNVIYGLNVNSMAVDLVAEYTAALEQLKYIDTPYSHAFGSTNLGLISAVDAYLQQQAEPYEGHERIAIMTYDTEDVYKLGTDTISSMASGVINIAGTTFNPQAAGLTVGDNVEIYNTTTGEITATVQVTATPSGNAIHTNSTVDYSSPNTKAVFLTNSKDTQAALIAGLAIQDRRMSILCPGYFQADINGKTYSNLPPYYISAAISGMDSRIVASKSFTNMNFTPAGLSNLVLNTNTYFRKSQLDIIGGGGIDIMIQDSYSSPTIRSRHDLTTDMSAVELRERSVTKQADVAAKTLRAAVAPYVGQYNITDALFQFLNQICSIVSGKLVKSSILKSLAVTNIARDPVVIDKINFFITATVFVAGNYYDITLLVKA